MSDPTAAEGLVPVRRALLSVSDKTGLAAFAAALHNEFGVELISTGGTAKFLRDAGLPVTDVADVTGFPEMMDGRVKTLHPKVHGGLLALRDHADHLASMQEHGIRPIDLVCINLYPFQQTIERPGVTFDEAIENIDIGGPSMVRSAAKNHAWVVVVTSPDRYDTVLGDLRKHAGRSCGKLRLKQAQAAFSQTAEYDGRIAKYLAQQITPKVEPPADREWTVHDLTHLRGTLRHLAETGSDPQGYLDSLIRYQAIVAGTGARGATFLVGLDSSTVDDLALMSFIWVASVAEAESLKVFALETVQSKTAVAIRMGAAANPSTYALVVPHLHERVIHTISVVLCSFETAEAAEARLPMLQALTDAYDQFAFRHPMSHWADEPKFPHTLWLSLQKKKVLRYGENPHQLAALYVGTKPHEASVAFATQHHGKELSYINLLDADGALACVKEFAAPAACIVKHTTPCGCAAADDVATAFQRAYAGDPLAAFGGIVAVNKPIDLAAAEAITSIDKLLEVIVAPYYAEDALELLRSRWKNVRLLEVGPIVQGSDAASPARRDLSEINLHKIVGGYLVQERDLLGLDESAWRVASRRRPTEQEMADLRFAWLVCKHVKSNAIAVCKGRMLLGAGAGQMDRPSAARLAIAKAGERIAGAVAASDAFFPFPDGPKLLLDAGVTAIVHPGGSLKDQDTIDLVDRQGAALVLTGQRHFKH